MFPGSLYACYTIPWAFIAAAQGCTVQAISRLFCRSRVTFYCQIIQVYSCYLPLFNQLASSSCNRKTISIIFIYSIIRTHFIKIYYLFKIDFISYFKIRIMFPFLNIMIVNHIFSYVPSVYKIIANQMILYHLLESKHSLPQGHSNHITFPQLLCTLHLKIY